MEILLLIAVCFVIWKVIDSNSKKQEIKDKTHTTTVIKERVGNTVVERTIVEETKINITDTTTKPRSELYPLASNNEPGLKTITRSDAAIIDARNKALKQASSTANFSKPISSEVISSSSDPVALKTISSDGVRNKKCTKCLKTYVLNRFSVSNKSSNPDGYSKWCLNCLNEPRQEKNSSRYKVCKKCKNRREKWNFYNSPKTEDGLSVWCKPCHAKRK